MKRLGVCFMAVLLFAALAIAHGDPLMGTVTAVSKDTVTVKDAAGKTVVVMLDKSTKYVKDKKPVAIADVKVGTRVAIDAHMDEKMKMLTAEEVQVGAAAAKPEPAKPESKKN